MPYSIHQGKTLHSFDIVEYDGLSAIPAVSKLGRAKMYFNKLTNLIYYSENGGAWTPFSQATTATSATFLLVTRTLAEDVGIKKLVRATSGTHAGLADKGTEAEATVLGLSMLAGVTGEDIPILLFGNDLDVLYTFPLNKPLFLTTAGGYSDTPPIQVIGEYLTTIGESNGTGSLFLNIEKPIEIL